jgi:hypothetical protein
VLRLVIEVGQVSVGVGAHEQRVPVGVRILHALAYRPHATPQYENRYPKASHDVLSSKSRNQDWI